MEAIGEEVRTLLTSWPTLQRRKESLLKVRRRRRTARTVRTVTRIDTIITINDYLLMFRIKLFFSIISEIFVISIS